MSNNLPAMVDKSGKPVRKGRIRPAMATAIRLIEEEGLTVREAAERVGYQAESLSKGMCKPHVRAFRADVKRAWREAAGPKAWNQIAKLSEDAASEKVQLEASKTVLTALGDLVPEGQEAGQGVALIQFIRNETHVHAAQPLTQRMPGVTQVEEYQDADFEALDSDGGLTPGEEP